MSGSKLKAKDAQDQLLRSRAQEFAHAAGYDPQVEQTMLLSEDSGSSGTEQGVSPPLTRTESEKLNQQAVLHELTGCNGGELIYLPGWLFDQVEVPPAWCCNKCNHMVVLGYPETYFG